MTGGVHVNVARLRREIALRENDVINGGSAELVLFLLGLESLLLKFASFAGGFDLSTTLLYGDRGVAADGRRPLPPHAGCRRRQSRRDRVPV